MAQDKVTECERLFRHLELTQKHPESYDQTRAHHFNQNLDKMRSACTFSPKIMARIENQRDSWEWTLNDALDVLQYRESARSCWNEFHQGGSSRDILTKNPHAEDATKCERKLARIATCFFFDGSRHRNEVFVAPTLRELRWYWKPRAAIRHRLRRDE